MQVVGGTMPSMGLCEGEVRRELKNDDARLSREEQIHL